MFEPPPRPKISDASLSVILLASRDGAELEGVLQAWAAVLNVRAVEFELIVVTTGEAQEWEVLKGSFLQLRVVYHVGKAGMGPALEAGLRAASHPLVAIAPADRQYLPEDVAKFLQVIDQVDLVTGYRMFQPVPWWLRAFDQFKRLCQRIVLGGAPDRRECWLGWAGYGRRWIAKHGFGVRVTDPECGFRMVRKELFRRIPIQSQGTFAVVEILAKANHLAHAGGGWMTEVPVTWTPPLAPQPIESPTFGQEARALFRHPQFGPPILPDDPAFAPYLGKPAPSEESPQEIAATLESTQTSEPQPQGPSSDASELKHEG